jgi:hypothetical protein
VRGEGAYVVVSPSRTVSPYAWLDRSRPRIRDFCWGKRFSPLDLTCVALDRGGAHAEGLGGLDLRHPPLYGFDDLLSEVF